LHNKTLGPQFELQEVMQK